MQLDFQEFYQNYKLNDKDSTIKAYIESWFKTNLTNEEDATKFYIDQTQRKKDLGGKYNAKVLDSTYDDMEDEDDEE